MQTPSLMTGAKKDDKRFSYLMQFIDGNRIDLTLIPYEERGNYIKEDSLTKVLLDKVLYCIAAAKYRYPF